jgi:hypothetical protein
MKIVRTSAPPPIRSRSIKRFSEPAPAAPPPEHETPRASNDVAAHAVRIASTPGSINPKQQVY